MIREKLAINDWIVLLKENGNNHHDRAPRRQPSVIVPDEDEPSARMRHMMQAMGQKNLPELKPTLEINPDHEIIKKLRADPTSSEVDDAAWMLFDQALLLEGVPLRDATVFVQRLNRVLDQSI